MDVGKIHIYTGDGKGKTSAAFGLAMRVCGCGGKACVVQFLKTQDSGEVTAARQLPGFEVIRFETDHGFFWNMDDTQRQRLLREVEKEFAFCRKLVLQKDCDLLVMDEVIGALQNGLVEKDALCDLLDLAHGRVEVALTGRNAPDWLVDRADYVSCIDCVKHPFDEGCPARLGIEF